MNTIEEFLQKNPKLTFQIYVDHNTAFVAGLYHNDKGDKVASVVGSTLIEAMKEAVIQAKKAGFK